MRKGAEPDAEGVDKVEVAELLEAMSARHHHPAPRSDEEVDTEELVGVEEVEVLVERPCGIPSAVA